MKHTLETLLPLLDSPEGLEELRMLTAFADEGWYRPERLANYPSDKVWLKRDHGNRYFYGSDIPNYTTSLDAIFAAEERIGLHDRRNGDMRALWDHFMWVASNGVPDILSLTAAWRCLLLILTAQEIRAAVKDAQ